MKLTVETRSKAKFNTLLAFLKSNGYKVQVQSSSAIADDDWCMPGRAANEKKLSILQWLWKRRPEAGMPA